MEPGRRRNGDVARWHHGLLGHSEESTLTLTLIAVSLSPGRVIAVRLVLSVLQVLLALLAPQVRLVQLANRETEENL